METLKCDNFRDRRVYEIGLIAIRDVSPPFGGEPWPWTRNAWGRGSMAFVYLLFQLTKYADSYGIVGPYGESLYMYSEGRVIVVVLGTEFSDNDRRTGDDKTMPKNWCMQFTRTVSVYNSLGRLATAS